MTAIFRHEGIATDYTNGGGTAITAGTLIALGNGFFGVTRVDIDPGKTGSIAIGGVVEVTKDDPADVFAVGDLIDLDDVGQDAAPAAGDSMHRAVMASANGATTVWVAINVGSAGLAGGGGGGGLVVTVSGGATITHGGEGTAPVFSSSAGVATLTPNGNTILSVDFSETSSGGGVMAFTHNVGRPPGRTDWTTSSGIEYPSSNSTITSANLLTVTGLNNSISYRHLFTW